MLALLSAPRGRVSAARVVAWIRTHGDAHGAGAGPPRALAPPAAPQYHPHALPAGPAEPAQS